MLPKINIHYSVEQLLFLKITKTGNHISNKNSVIIVFIPLIFVVMSLVYIVILPYCHIPILREFPIDITSSYNCRAFSLFDHSTKFVPKELIITLVFFTNYYCHCRCDRRKLIQIQVNCNNTIRDGNMTECSIYLKVWKSDQLQVSLSNQMLFII